MLIQDYRDAWGEALHGVYVRGSLVKGQAVSSYSDLDSFAVLKPNADAGESRDWARVLEANIQRSFPFVADVELGVETFEDALGRTGIYTFIIKTEATCIDGENLANRLEPYRITPEIAFQT